MDIADYTREIIKEGGVVGSLFRRGLSMGDRAARVGRRLKHMALRSTVGRRGMVGKGVREAGKGMLTSPIKTMKKGFSEMSGGEKAIMGAMGTLAAQDSAGKLEPGETRLGRIGANVGTMAGYLATPFRRVGMLGNILAGDVIGNVAGRQAGRLASKVTGVGGKAKPRYAAPPGSMEAKFRG